jgi:hypothetical protein
MVFVYQTFWGGGGEFLNAEGAKVSQSAQKGGKKGSQRKRKKTKKIRKF